MYTRACCASLGHRGILVALGLHDSGRELVVNSQGAGVAFDLDRFVAGKFVERARRSPEPALPTPRPRLRLAHRRARIGVVIGEPGVGKTSAMRHLCRALPLHEHRVLYLADTNVKPLDLPHAGRRARPAARPPRVDRRLAEACCVRVCDIGHRPRWNLTSDSSNECAA